MESGQSAVESRILSRDVIVSGGIGRVNCGRSAKEGRIVHRRNLKFVQRRRCLWWYCGVELRTVRNFGADSPPYSFEVCPET